MWWRHDPPCPHHVLADHDHCRDWRMDSGGDAMTRALMMRREVMDLLGYSPDTFRRRLPCLVRAGFPEIDTVTDRYIRADVEAWLASRRKIKPESATLTESQSQGVNTDVL